jgi:hypothetical protein
MSKEPKKHHYVPQAVLRRFSIRDEGRQVYAFDKATRRSYVAAITNAGSENHFYSVEVGDDRLTLEYLFDGLDSKGAELLAKVCQDRSLGGLSEDERMLLCAVAAAQLLRVKRMRSDLVEVSHQLIALLEGYGGELENSGDHVMSEQHARIYSIENILRLPHFAEPFLGKDLVLISSGAGAFFIGDNPVVISNSFPYGNLGLASPGVEIYFPISRYLVIGFYCRSIRRYLERFESWGEARYQPLLDAIRTGGAFEYSAEQVGHLNQLQVARATQFLYSAGSDFSVVLDLLGQVPKLANGKASVGIHGWEDYARRESMPEGAWVVVVGQNDHSMIPAELVEGETAKDCEFAFRTTLLEMVLSAISDGPFKEVTLFVDRTMRRQIRDVIFQIAEDGTICVRMRDEGLHRLFRMLDNERK